MNGLSPARNMTAVNTRHLVEDYVRFRLERSNLHWSPDRQGNPGGPQAQAGCTTTAPPSRVEQTMRALGQEFEQRYTEVFEEMCNQLHITPRNAESTFTTIVNELFSGGIKWGRIVALFSFGGTLAMQCLQKEMPLLVEQTVDWVTQYIDSNLQSWIQENGGWEGFVEFYEGGAARSEESPWPSLRTICTYAAGGIAALTLGAILSQKT